MKDDCRICGGVGKIKLPYRLRLSDVVIAYSASGCGEPTPAKSFEEYPCPQCQPGVDRSTVGRVYAAARYDVNFARTLKPDAHETLMDNLRHNIAKTIVSAIFRDENAVRFRVRSVTPLENEMVGDILVVKDRDSESVLKMDADRAAVEAAGFHTGVDFVLCALRGLVVARDNATIDRHDLVWVETEARRRMASVPGRADAANAETTGE